MTVFGRDGKLAVQAEIKMANSPGDGPPKLSKQPKNTKLTQQELPACRPVLEFHWVMYIFVAVAAVLLPLGIVCLIYGMQPVEFAVRYDDKCITGSTVQEQLTDLWARQLLPPNCAVTVDITADMAPPIFVYYELDGVYQNHRRYVKSRNDVQLAGKPVSVDDLKKSCELMLFYNRTQDMVIDPCGLVAWSNFNDTYELTKVATAGALPTPIEVASRGIALPADVRARFGHYNATNFNPDLNRLRGGWNLSDPTNTSVQVPVNENERFILWMRTAALPNFRKLWGRIDTPLKAGDKVEIKIANRWNTYSFQGRKSVVLGTTNWLGSQNPFLGIAFLSTGGVSLLMAAIYGLLRCFVPDRKFGDPLTLADVRD